LSSSRSGVPVVAQPRWVRAALWAGICGVVLYVAGWALAGALRTDYDPSQQAISELFAFGAPWVSRGPLLVGLVLSGLAMIALAPALHRSLPGHGVSGPVLVAVAGAGTLGVVLAPCSEGCPGVDAGGTDAAHALAAAVGYLALVTAPLAFGWRLHRVLPWVARWSWLLGGVAVTGLAVRYLGLATALPGLQQRLFNTVADLWYLGIAVWLLRGGGTSATALSRDGPHRG